MEEGGRGMPVFLGPAGFGEPEEVGFLHVR